VRKPVRGEEVIIVVVIGAFMLAVLSAAGWAATVLLAEAELEILELVADRESR
jgi:hypothetical protein